MSEYHKIQSIFKRDMENNKRLIEGDWTLPEFKYLANNDWVFTEKVDGTNIRIIYENGKVTFGGRTNNASIPAQLTNRLNEIFLPLESKMGELFESAVLYGEGYGNKIQKVGSLYSPTQDFVLFDVRIGKWWLNRVDVEDIAGKLGLAVVPIIGVGTLWQACVLAREGIRSTWGDFEAEGIVGRPEVELCTRSGERIIAKIKCRDFKMMNDELSV